MLTIECAVPGAPGLRIAAAVLGTPRGPVAATGVDPQPHVARARCASEMAERRVLAEQSPRGPVAAAAWPDPAGALIGAAFEAAERISCGLWWAGRNPPRLPEPAASEAMARAAIAWRRAPARPLGLLDVTLPGSLPAAVAWSCQRGTTDGLCFGTAAAPTIVEAACSALRELVQMEFGLETARALSATGVALEERERETLRRAETLRLADCDAILRSAAPRAPTELVAATHEAVLGGLAPHAGRLEPRLLVAPGETHAVAMIEMPTGLLDPVPGAPDWRRFTLYGAP